MDQATFRQTRRKMKVHHASTQRFQKPVFLPLEKGIAYKEQHTHSRCRITDVKIIQNNVTELIQA